MHSIHVPNYQVVYKVRFGVPTSDTAEPYRHAGSAVDDCRLLPVRIPEVTRRPGRTVAPECQSVQPE